ncbi:hypothetical protein NW841_07875 [Synechococcus sp. H60.3]|uniref:hypothetical protein n=1 Tax=Synechococcus sp. H60.3 TaxID=2967124 RepID=UPI0039C06FB8
MAARVAELAAALPPLPRLAFEQAQTAAHCLALGVLHRGAALALPSLIWRSRGVPPV